MKCLYKGLGMRENINKWKLSLSDKISCGLVLSKCSTKQCAHHCMLQSASDPLSDTHLAKYNCGQKPTVPNSHHSESLAPLGCNCWTQECGEVGDCLLLLPCPLSDYVSIFFVDHYQLFYQRHGDLSVSCAGVSAGSSLWLVIKIGLFRLSFSQLVIFLLIDGFLLAGSILDRQHKVNQSSGQFRGPGCLYNCPHFITVESEPKSDTLTLSVTRVRSKYSPEFTSFHSLLHPSTIGHKFSCIWKAWV